MIMYSLSVRDYIFIAHSLREDVFGPAQALHGTTYTVDAEFRKERLDEHNVVIDIGLATRILKEVLSQLNYKNLDEMKEFRSKTTTTEFLAKHIHDRIRIQIASFFKGSLKITLHESPVAWGSYESQVE
jgi:6-pyruvoyltetrahydropterin/6-carboxytetrahydropterin synthase